MLLMIDNYDSFTYNLVHYFEEQGAEVHVAANDEITLPEIQQLSPTAIVISPGPGSPDDSGISCDVIKAFGKTTPILGVCLGLQCIASVYGASILRAKKVMHGKISEIHHAGKDIFKNIPSPFSATRYHSLVVEQSNLTPELEITATSELDNEIMALKHVKLPIYGVQFHPEAVLTRYGHTLITNFLRLSERWHYKNAKLPHQTTTQLPGGLWING